MNPVRIKILYLGKIQVIEFAVIVATRDFTQNFQSSRIQTSRRMKTNQRSRVSNLFTD